jgi:hypothetical protein
VAMSDARFADGLRYRIEIDRPADLGVPEP